MNTSMLFSRLSGWTGSHYHLFGCILNAASSAIINVKIKRGTAIAAPLFLILKSRSNTFD